MRLTIVFCPIAVQIPKQFQRRHQHGIVAATLVARVWKRTRHKRLPLATRVAKRVRIHRVAESDQERNVFNGVVPERCDRFEFATRFISILTETDQELAFPRLQMHLSTQFTTQIKTCLFLIQACSNFLIMRDCNYYKL